MNNERNGAIENERQVKAALSWIDYWKAAIADESQHWLALEQARHEIMQLQYRVNDYRQRQAREQAATQAPEPLLVA